MGFIVIAAIHPPNGRRIRGADRGAPRVGRRWPGITQPQLQLVSRPSTPCVGGAKRRPVDQRLPRGEKPGNGVDPCHLQGLPRERRREASREHRLPRRGRTGEQEERGLEGVHESLAIAHQQARLRKPDRAWCS